MRKIVNGINAHRLETNMRLSFIPPAELTPEQRPLYDDMKAGISAKYSAFTTIREDGAILGPWSAWLHEPELGTAIWGVTKAMTRFKHLPERLRQIVILVVGCRFKAKYEIYAHTVVAKSAGVTDDQVQAILAGRRPRDLSDSEDLAYVAVTALLQGGVLTSPIYEKALASFGQHGLNELIYLVGHYCFVSITLNGFDIPLPDADPL
jgi:4-carboxymuconolactone decarboxylase